MFLSMDQFSPAYFHQMSDAKFKLLRGTPGKESFKDVGPLNVNQHPWLPIGINASRLGTHTKKKIEENAFYTDAFRCNLSVCRKFPLFLLVQCS